MTFQYFKPLGGIALSQLTVTATCLAMLGFAIAILCGFLSRQGARIGNCTAFDAYRAGGVFGLWAGVVGVSTLIYPRLFIDDYYHIYVLSYWIWIGALGSVILFLLSRIGHINGKHILHKG